MFNPSSDVRSLFYLSPDVDRSDTERGQIPRCWTPKYLEGPVSKDDTCSICLQNYFPTGELVLALSCGHYFHPECIWKLPTAMGLCTIDSTKSCPCPTCRALPGDARPPCLTPRYTTLLEEPVSKDDTCCCICLQNYSPTGDLLLKLPCGHYFHPDCICKHLSNGNGNVFCSCNHIDSTKSCPLCRASWRCSKCAPAPKGPAPPEQPIPPADGDPIGGNILIVLNLPTWPASPGFLAPRPTPAAPVPPPDTSSTSSPGISGEVPNSKPAAEPKPGSKSEPKNPKARKPKPERVMLQTEETVGQNEVGSDKMRRLLTDIPR